MSTKMNLYLISQNRNVFEHYGSAVVVAESEKEAIHIHPEYKPDMAVFNNWWKSDIDYDTWVHPRHVNVELIGKAIKGLKKGPICANF